MKNRKVLLTALLLFCAAPRNGTAQSHAPEELETVELHFSVFPLEPAEWAGIHYAPDGNPEKAEPIDFNLQERSILYEYKGPVPLRFFRIEKNQEGLPVYKTVGVLDLEPGSQPDNLILFFDPEQPAGPYRITRMPDREDTFPDESLVFYNTMNVTFNGVLGTNRFQLPPGLSSPINVRAYFESPAPIALAIDHEGEMHLVLRNKVRFSPERRTLIILRPPSRPGSLRIRTQRLTEYTGKLGKDDSQGN